MPFFKRNVNVNVNVRRSSNETDNKSADDALLDYDDVNSAAGGGGDGTLVTVRDDDHDDVADDKSFAKRSFFRFAARRSGQAKQSSVASSSVSVSSRSDPQNNNGKSHDDENGKYACDSASDDDDDDDDGNRSGNYPCVHLSPPPPSSASRKNSLFSVENSIAELAAFQIGDDHRDHLQDFENVIDDDASLAPSIDKYGFIHEGGGGGSSAPRDVDVDVDNAFCDDALDRGSVLTSNSSLHDAASSAVSNVTGATFDRASLASKSRSGGHPRGMRSAAAAETSHLLRTKVTGVPKRRRNKNFARQGIKDEARRRAWVAIPNVDEVVAKRRGEYDRLVERAAAEILELTSRRRDGGAGRDGDGGTDDPLKKGRRRSALDEHPGGNGHSLDWWDTLERDLGRTFPKHLLFRRLKDFQGVGDKVRPDGSRAILFKGDNARIFGANCDDANDDFNASDRSRLTDTSIAIPKPFHADQQQQQLQQQQQQQRDKDEDDDDNSDAFEQVAKFAVQSTGQAALRRLLRAYSTYDPQVGYCQGMNFIAALFLMVMDDEETAFWMFVSVMNEDVYNLRELFVRDMAGTQEVLYVAERLIEQFLPRLFDHFQLQNVQMSMILTPWLMTIYTRNFPFELVLRVWDSFLVEGWKVVYRTMLALLEHAQPALLQLEFEEIIMYLREFTSTVGGPNIMMASLKISLRRKHILKYVAEWKGLSEKGETRKVDTGVFNRLNTRGSEVVSSMGFGSFVDT